MNGHKDSSGNFHPHSDSSSKNVKSSDTVWNDGKRESVNHNDAEKLKDKKSKEQYNPNKQYLVASGKWWDSLSLNEKKKVLDENGHMKGNHVLDNGKPTTKENDEIHDSYLHGEHEYFPPHLWGTIERVYIKTQLEH